jgi:hypothetical protein
LLTEAVQVKKAIALAQTTRHGMCLDRARLDQAEADLRQRLHEAAAAVGDACPGLYKLDREGDLVVTATGAPSKSTAALDAKLQQVAEGLRQGGLEVSVPLTAKARKPSTSTKFWGEYADHDPFVRAWVEVEALAKELSFYGRLRGAHVHPNYTALVRSGRTSCSGPNIQQVPRDGPLRPAFVASPGHLLLAVDYKHIELTTLAAVCQHRYGRSALAEVIREGKDPHSNTAALMLGLSPGEFLGWKKDPQREAAYDAARQAAKAVNFGVPGGLGVASLVAYARHTYKVALTEDEARQRRDKLLGIYPELEAYLAEDACTLLARNLKADPAAVRARWDALFHLSCVRKVLAGNPRNRQGEPYGPDQVERIWRAVAGLNRDPALAEDLGNRRPSKALAARVCQAGVATLTGRIRGNVSYTQCRNTPFQGLAADGAALALFALVKEGFRVVGFIHDEVLVELPDEGGYVSEEKVRRVQEIMCRTMEEVLVGDIPVACEATLSRRWNKKARLVVKDGRVYPWEPEGGDPVPAIPSPQAPGPADSRAESAALPADQPAEQGKPDEAPAPPTTPTALLGVPACHADRPPRGGIPPDMGRGRLMAGVEMTHRDEETMTMTTTTNDVHEKALREMLEGLEAIYPKAKLVLLAKSDVDLPPWHGTRELLAREVLADLRARIKDARAILEDGASGGGESPGGGEQGAEGFTGPLFTVRPSPSRGPAGL